MIVQCPSCASRYRVNDANIPPSGGKIRCPSCAHAFVVYPDAEEEEEADKTSIAARPNLKELLSSMQQKGTDALGQPEDEEEEVARTEVMSGAEMPDFSGLFGGAPPDGDQTVEMSNPLFQKGLAELKKQHQKQPVNEDDLHTQELNSDIVDASLNHIRDQAESVPPIEPPEDDEPATQIAPPPMRDQLPQRQKRISVPDNPTPAPRGQAGSPPASHQNQPPPTRSSTNPGQGFPPSRPGSSAPTGQGFGSTPSPQSGPQSAPQNFGSTPASPGAQSPGSSPGTQSPGFGSTPSPGPTAPQQGPDASHEGPWKLQTNFGLTYEFADNKSLKKWLDSRDDLDGYNLSTDGDSFYPLDDFPQVRGGAINQSGGNRAVASSGSHPNMPGVANPGPGRRTSGMGPVDQGPDSGPAGATGSGPTGSGPMGAGPMGSGPMGSGPMGSGPMGSGPMGSGPMGGQAGEQRSPFTTANAAVTGPGPDVTDSGKQKIDPNESYRPPSRDKAGLNIFLWIAFSILALAALALTAHLAGLIDLEELIGLIDDEEVVVEIVEEVVEEAPEEGPAEIPEPAAVRDPAEVDRILERARDEMESNRLSRAMELLDRAEMLDSERIQLYDMKAEVHEKLNEMDKAEAMRERAQQLRVSGGGSPAPSERSADE